jgi:ATP-dependent RNA/DNA helicase IGHMBP2
MTRAKLKLVVVGDSRAVGKTLFYLEMIAYAEALGGYESIWEYDPAHEDRIE